MIYNNQCSSDQQLAPCQYEVLICKHGSKSHIQISVAAHQDIDLLSMTDLSQNASILLLQKQQIQSCLRKGQKSLSGAQCLHRIGHHRLYSHRLYVGLSPKQPLKETSSTRTDSLLQKMRTLSKQSHKMSSRMFQYLADPLPVPAPLIQATIRVEGGRLWEHKPPTSNGAYLH